MPRLRTDYEVLSRHADPNGLLSVRVLVSMLFDSADLHAAQWGVSLGQLAESNRTWVLTRLHLRLDRQPKWNDKVSVETWPTGAIRLLAGRDFAVFVDDNKIGSATTLWLMIDRNTRKPVALPEFVSDFTPPEGSPAVRAKGVWPMPDPSATMDPGIVRWNDLDLNRHAGALSYLDWMIGPLPHEARESTQLSELDILFKEEAFLDESIGATVSEIGSDGDSREFSHAVVAAGSDRILAVARTKWTP